MPPCLLPDTLAACHDTAMWHTYQAVAAWCPGSDFVSAADPFLNDETFLVSQLSLEENGATGNKGLAGILGAVMFLCT